VIIRRATDQDWPRIYAFYAAIMAEGKTYPFPERQTPGEAKPWWMLAPAAFSTARTHVRILRQ
jgi:hypothetical protein